jgi:hypothetical protein
MSDFTIQDGLAVQTEHLLRWQKLLKPEVYKKVYEKAQQMNTYLRESNSGYSVWRGTFIDNYILNLSFEIKD